VGVKMNLREMEQAQGGGSVGTDGSQLLLFPCRVLKNEKEYLKGKEEGSTREARETAENSVYIKKERLFKRKKGPA